MKVLMITSSFPRYNGDHIGNFVYELAINILSEQTEIIVLCPHSEGTPREEIMSGIKVIRFPYFFPSNYQCLAGEGGLFNNFSRSLLAKMQVPLFAVLQLVYAFWIVWRERVEIIHTHWLIPQGLIGAICKIILGNRHITTIHGTDVTLSEKSFLLKCVIRFVVHYTDAISANSSYTKNVLLSIDHSARDKVSIIPMGVDIKKFTSNPIPEGVVNSNSPKIIFVGRLINLKGIDYLLKAMVTVIRHIPDAQLTICGNGPEKKRLEGVTATLGISKNVSFLGSINHVELPRYYQSADLLVLPSVTVMDQTEALGVVLLEAMACGIPVIGSDVGGIPDIIYDGWNGYLVPEKSPEMMANQIIRILTDSKIHKKFAANGLVTVKEKFSWDYICSRYSYIYCNVVNT